MPDTSLLDAIPELSTGAPTPADVDEWDAISMPDLGILDKIPELNEEPRALASTSPPPAPGDMPLTHMPRGPPSTSSDECPTSDEEDEASDESSTEASDSKSMAERVRKREARRTLAAQRRLEHLSCVQQLAAETADAAVQHTKKATAVTASSRSITALANHALNTRGLESLDKKVAEKGSEFLRFLCKSVQESFIPLEDLAKEFPSVRRLAKDDDDPTGIEFYVRGWSFTSAQSLKQQATTFGASHPHEAPFVAALQARVDAAPPTANASIKYWGRTSTTPNAGQDQDDAATRRKQDALALGQLHANFSASLGKPSICEVVPLRAAAALLSSPKRVDRKS